MNSSALKRTLVADLQYDPKFSDCKDELFPIISRSTINCVPQWKFATRSNQHWENVEIRVPIPLMTKATELKDKIDRLVYYVYEEDDEYAIQDVELRPQIIYSDIEPEVSNDVEFDRIQDVLIQGSPSAFMTQKARRKLPAHKNGRVLLSGLSHFLRQSRTEKSARYRRV